MSWAQVEQITNHGKYFLKIHKILFQSLESKFCTGFLVFGIFTHLDNLSNISLGTEECRSFVNSWKKQFCMYAKAKSSKIIMVFLAHPYINIVSVVFLQYTLIIVARPQSRQMAEPRA